MRVHASQAYRKMDVRRERNSCITKNAGHINRNECILVDTYMVKSLIWHGPPLSVPHGKNDNVLPEHAGLLHTVLFYCKLN